MLSTLHTNDAPTAITRLRDIGLDANMISSSLLCVLAQRLVRVVCASCKEEYQPDEKVFKDLRIPSDPGMKYFHGKGCPDCGHTGYWGRIGIFELLEMTDPMRVLVRKGIPLEEIRESAVKAGMRTLKEDGMDKVRKGLTTVEEMLRVTQD